MVPSQTPPERSDRFRPILVLMLAATLKGESGGGTLTLFLLALAVAVAGFAFLNPSVSALVSRRTSADRQGEVLGVNQSANALARILGPLVGLSLFPLTANHVLPYAFASAMLLIVLLMTPRLDRN